MGEKIKVHITPYGAEQCGGSFEYDESVSDIEIAGRFLWDLVIAGKIDVNKGFPALGIKRNGIEGLYAARLSVQVEAYDKRPDGEGGV